jgi:hypothetical protein
MKRVTAILAGLLVSLSSAQASTYSYTNTLAITSQTCTGGQACSYPNVPLGLVSMLIYFPGDTTEVSGTFNVSFYDPIIVTAFFETQNGFTNTVNVPPSVAGPLFASITLSNGSITDWSFHGTFSRLLQYCGVCDSLDSTAAGDHVVYTITSPFTDFSSYTIVYDGGPGTWTGPPATTPLPAAWPLFATGLGALGLLGWRRKRKQAA